MKEQLRTLVPQANICLIYKNPDEWLKVVVSFIEIGLKRKEKCLCISSEHSATGIRRHISVNDHDMRSAEKNGRLGFISAKEFMAHHDFSTPSRFVMKIQHEAHEAFTKGFTALRYVFEIPPEGILPDVFLKNAVTLNKSLPNMKPCLILQTVDQKIAEPGLVRNAIITYPNLIYNHHLYHNFYYITDMPARGLEHGKLGTDYWLKNLEREKECQERAFFLTDVMEHSSQPFLAGYPDGRIKAFNPAFSMLTGYDKNELKARNWNTWFTPKKWRKTDREVLEKLNVTKQPQHYEKEIMRKDGTTVPVELFLHQINDADGVPLYYYAFINDITERKRTDNVLRESEERYRNLIETAPDAIYSISKHGILLSLNPAFEKITGWQCSEWTGKPFTELIHPDDLQFALKTFEQVIDGKTPPIYHLRIRTKSGGYVVGEFISTPMIENGVITGEFGIGRDITARVQAEEALREGERFLANIFASIQDGISILDTDMNVIRTNAAMERYYSHSMPLCGHKCYHVYHGRTEPCLVCPSRRTIVTGNPAFEVVPKTGPEGKQVGWMELYSFPLKDIKTGKLTGVIEYVRDITERKKLEMQLVQSQKMETIGRLVGGLAHDFNNLLTAIMNHAIFVRDSLTPGSQAFEDINEVIKTSERAANLTKQLLTFSRNQPVNPQIININSVLTDMKKMLMRLVRDDIELVLKMAPDIYLIRIDRGQLEQVIVNLVLNANDAMPDGGRLTIETANINMEDDLGCCDINLAGRYVLLSVNDTGIGMPEDVKAHLFEPFFTTKEKGRGTGLGLATCYGIVKQNGGEIKVLSEPGRGTTFNICLPKADKKKRTPGHTLEHEQIPKGNETILLVDDEPMVRSIVGRVLRNQGYEILENESALAALSAAGHIKNRGLHLLVTDVVMPEMSGKELAEKIKEIHPDIKVLFISGYTNNIISRHGVSDETEELLQKPFSATQLAKKVREILDR